MKSMKKGDKVIWDSGFGYEIGIYESESSIIYANSVIDICSGRHVGFRHLPTSQIIEYNTHNKVTMSNKYGYEKSFSETF